MRKSIVLSVSITVLLAMPAHAGEEMRPGKWQVTQTTEMAGMQARPHTITYCHKAGDAKEPLPGQSMPEGCKAGEMERSGNTFRWQFSCTGENSMQGSGEMTQHAETYDGVMRMKTAAGEMTTRMQGKRLGDC